MPAFNISSEALIGTAALGVAALAGFWAGRRRPRFPFGTPKHSHFEKDNPLYQYVLDYSLREHPVLKELRLATIKTRGRRMMVSCDEAQLMANLAKLIKVKKAIEIGVYTGYNTLNMALVLPDDGKVIACDISDEFADTGKPFWKKAGVEHKIDLRINPASQTLDELLENGEAGTFDFAFIDADKEAYNDYYEKCLHLLRKGGIIAIDNVLMSGSVLKPESYNMGRIMHQLNEKIFHDPRVAISMILMWDGLTLAFKL